MNETRPHDSPAKLYFGPADESAGIRQCCRDTIDRHSAFNPMMVCGGCQQIIKCFHKEKDYRNYCKFCESRGRPIQTAQYAELFIVIFNSYSS